MRSSYLFVADDWVEHFRINYLYPFAHLPISLISLYSCRYDLPAKYRIVFWGKRGRCDDCNKEDRAISYYPPCPSSGRRKEDVDTYNGVLNPAGLGDIIQYAACPGPNERQNMRSTSQYWGVRNGNLGGLEFITLEPVPKDTQLCHWYGPGWWSARGVKRMDVGTKKYPAPLRTASNSRQGLK